MHQASQTQIMIRVLTFAMGMVVATEVFAQVPVISQPGTITGIVQIKQNSIANLTNVDVFVVPAGQRLRITDVIISAPSNGSAGACCQRIFAGAGCITQKTGFITVPGEPGGSFQHSFLSGINFGAGQVVCLRNGASSGATSWTLSGYLFTGGP
jgi:hypothetical protein